MASPITRVLWTRAEAPPPGEGVVHVPLIQTRPTGRPLPALREGDVVVVSSAEAARALTGLDLRAVRLAAVGPATAAACPRPPDLVPSEASGAALAATLGALPGRRVIWPRAAEPTPGVADALRATGAELVEVVAYETSLPDGAEANLRAALPADWIALASASAARHLAALGLDLGGARIACIGPTTAAAARAAGLPVHAIAARPEAAALLDACAGEAR